MKNPSLQGGVSVVRAWSQSPEFNWNFANAISTHRAVVFVWIDPEEAVVALEARALMRAGQTIVYRIAIQTHLSLAYDALFRPEESARARTRAFKLVTERIDTDATACEIPAPSPGATSPLL